jgi:hypothetical protein
MAIGLPANSAPTVTDKGRAKTRDNGGGAATMTDDLTVARINDALLDMIGTVLKDRAETLLGQGLTDDELNVRLASYIPEVNQWRADTLRLIKRAMNDPFAPTWTLN